MHDDQHLTGYGYGSLAGAMFSFDSLIEVSHAWVVLSCGLGALAEDPSGSFAAFLGYVSCPAGFSGLMYLWG